MIYAFTLTIKCRWNAKSCIQVARQIGWTDESAVGMGQWVNGSMSRSCAKTTGCPSVTICCWNKHCGSGVKTVNWCYSLEFVRCFYTYLCHVIPRNLIWKKLYVFFACHGCACDVVLGSRLVLHNRQSDSINVPVIFIDVWIHTLTTNRSVIWEHLKSFRKILEMARSERSKLTILGWT